ncbi:MAG: RCC1 domain-containing protein [Ilumatobacteraceae bacterium]
MFSPDCGLMRRIVILLALVGGSLVAVSSPVSADSAESVNDTVRTSMSKIASGMAHSCRVLDSGHVACWGLNTNGPVGTGNTTKSTTPMLVSGVSTATSVAIGSVHTCVVLADTTVKCWGRGEFGRIGDGNGAGTDRTSPVTVCADAACTTSLSGVASLALSIEASCALKTDGTVWCWGDNNDWQLGTDPSTSVTGRTYAGEVSGLTGVKAISAGDYHTCVILNDDTPRCWGLSGMHQLGNGSTSPSGPSAVTIAGISTEKAIAGGYGHT